MRGVHNIIAIILLAGSLSGCSSGADGNATAKSGAGASNPTTPNAASVPSTAPVDNACDLLTDAEMRQVFPGAESGKRNTASLEYGLDRCAWKTSTGLIGVEVSKVEAAGFEKELRAELQGAVDPRVAGALDRIAFHAIDGIADHAILIVENADAHNGIYADIALLAIQRGHRMAVLTEPGGTSDPSAIRDRLEALGRKLAPRL